MSNIIAQQPVASQPQPSRTYKRTSHNIFGIPPEEQAKAKAKAEAEAAAAAAQRQHGLRPSAVIEAELERNEEFQRELKGEMTEADNQQAALENLKKEIQTQEQLNAQQADQEAQKAPVQVETPVPVPAPVATAPVPPPPQKPAARIHPNYRSSFTIGGPR